LGKVVSDHQKDWDEHVSYALTAYRATKDSATGFSPNYLVFGREKASPFELMFLGIPENEDDPARTHCEYVSVLKDCYRRSYAIVRENLKIATFQNKKKYDQRVKVAKYVPGDWVWVFYPRWVQGKSPKWQRYYDGPYLVLEAIGDVNYRVQRSNRSRKQVVHVNKIKKYLGQAPTNWNILGGGHDQPVEINPTTPELTFDDSFFSQLPEIYNPDDDVAEPPITNARDDDEGRFTVAPDFQGTTPTVTPARPRRIIDKPARFRWVKNVTDDDSEWYQPTDEITKECVLPSDDEN